MHACRSTLEDPTAAGELALIGPNCFGVLDFLHGAALWPMAFGGPRVEKGVAILTQSGNFAYNLSMCERSLPIACMVSVGNQAQTGIAELMDALLDEPRVTAIGIHVEGLRDPQAFSRAAHRALEKGVPVVALKTGVSQLGAQMALSHTSALAGSDALYDALFARHGVIRVSGPVTFIETLKVAASGRLPAGTTLVALASSGGDAGLVADYAERNGLVLPAISAEQEATLATLLPSYAHLANPLDFTTAPWGKRDALEQVIESMLATSADGALLVLDYPAEQTGERPDCDLILELFCAALARHDRAGLVASMLPELLPAHARARLNAAGVAALQGLEDALAAWARVARYRQLRAELLARGESALVPVRASADAQPGGLLDEWQSKQLLRAHGLPTPRAVLSTPESLLADAAQLGYPLVLKAVSAALPHKSEAGAVAINLRSDSELAAAWDTMRGRLERERPELLVDSLLLERMADAPLAELIVGITREPGFGLGLVIGGGGILVELLKDSRTLLLPTTDAAIRASVLELRSAPLLQGFRGRAAADLDQVVGAIRSIADFASEHADELWELDVNPLLVSASGVVAVDALIRPAAPHAGACASSDGCDVNNGEITGMARTRSKEDAPCVMHA